MISTLNSSYNRISGLASGMDTETLVKQLTMGTTKKIESAYQQKQLLEWKRDYYREITQKLNDFNNKYFGNSLFNLTIGDSLKQPKATSSAPEYVTVNATTDAPSGSLIISDIEKLASSAKLISSSPVSAQLSSVIDTSQLTSLGGTSMKFSLDGISKIVTFENKAYTTAEDVAAELNTMLSEAFGTDKITVSSVDNTLTFTPSNSTSKISIYSSGIAEETEAISLLNIISGASNRIKFNDTLSEITLAKPFDTDNIKFTINGKDFAFAADATLNTVINTINTSDSGVTISYSEITDKFTLTTKETGSGANISFIDKDLNNTNIPGSFINALIGDATVTAGEDAVLKVKLNGSVEEQTIIRSSNTFEIDKTVYTLHGMADGIEKENISINVAPDADTLVSKITDFVKDYNELVESINTKLSEERFKDFLPLTDEQKEALSETDQKLWTEKAKSGLLRNDMYLKSIVSEMRGSLYKEVKGLDSSGERLGFILPDIGITTGLYTENGKLKINETQLRKAISQNPDGVISLLTQNASISYSQYNTPENKAKRFEESGLLWRLSDIVKNNLSKVGKKGALIELVGSPDNQFLGDTAYRKKISDIEYSIIELTNKLSKEESRYYARFTAMESALSKLNSQSSWIGQQLGGR